MHILNNFKQISGKSFSQAIVFDFNIYALEYSSFDMFFVSQITLTCFIGNIRHSYTKFVIPGMKVFVT